MKRKFSVITRLSILLTLVSAVIMITLMMAVDDALKEYRRQSVQVDQSYLTDTMREQLESDASLLIRALGDNLSDAIYRQDLSGIGNTLENLRDYRDLDYIYVHDAQGRIIHDGSPAIKRYGEDVSTHLPPGSHSGLQSQLYWQGMHLYLHSPITAGGEPFAAIAVGFDFTAPLQIAAERAQALEANEREMFEAVRSALLIAFIILLPVCLVSARLLTKRMLTPLTTLTERSIRYANGERDLSFDLQREDELGRLGRALERMRLGLEESHDQVHQMAYEDPVTALPNRRSFQHKLGEIMHRSASMDNRFAVLFIDLDHFKQVNDTAGHAQGDQLLREVARRLSQILKQRHTRRRPQPLLARLGGDEFVVLLPAIETGEEAAEVARMLSAALNTPFLLSGQYFSISCSIGITLYPDDGVSSSEILKHADIAMYSAKQHGRNQFAFFQPQMTEEIRERLEIQQGIREAIEHDYLFLDYQPIYCMRSGQIRGAEALLRWKHPQHGLLSPARFIPIIEESDLIEDVTRWVAQRAVTDLQCLLELSPGFSLSINISGAALHQSAICDFICELKQQRNLPDDALCIEITETSMITHLESSENALRRWKANGIEIWIDDFGTGYSSLAYLNSLSIDGLKIDRSFVHNLIDGHSRPLIDAMVALAESLSIDTVAEGIETEQQHATLRDMGVDLAQGFGLARPMPLHELQARIRQEVQETA
ncbi:EAL domain-containing protein [Marinobacterium sp. D7]|uniref:putative bifunctional diguanylate cyclase/phosphodiesterase n=1 Tax=Marinobacterium ramblicola TaxID=2849041 RepID=UPI001C2DD060|nr:EAL domain-containing protein [Marinobacterium ramblicola]MBV1789275.1 EAL domain-containing protein [Marinobacterium ramblicola]